MAGITLEIAKARLDAWLAADEAVSKGQSLEMNGTKLTRAHAAEIRANITYWAQQVSQLEGRGSRFITVVPR